jgi:N6-adenosine-specific RNA methylase IME4
MERVTKYRTIVADPPWEVKAGPGGGGGYVVEDGRQVWQQVTTPTRNLPYPTLDIDAIAALVPPAEANAHLYLWTINAYVEASYGIARAWGFKPSTLIVWAKNPMGGGLGGAWGITTEYVLFARRGTLTHTGRVTGTWFNWKRAYNERGKPKHSAKPPAFLDLVEQVSPGPYLEMFARSNRLGWDTWGDEALCHVNLVTGTGDEG